jgi:hypothetical protein
MKPAKLKIEGIIWDERYDMLGNRRITGRIGEFFSCARPGHWDKEEIVENLEEAIEKRRKLYADKSNNL